MPSSGGRAKLVLKARTAGHGPAAADPGCQVVLAARGSELSVGLDRAAGGLAKSAKAGADVVRSTVIRISSVALQHQAETGKPGPWYDRQKRWFINFQPDPEGRKLTIKATLNRKPAA